MSIKSKQQLDVENQTSFPNNTTGYITPEGLRTFNNDMIDSTVNQTVYTTESASFDLRIDNLEGWSSSLANTIATKLDTASFNSYTQSTQTTFNQFSSSTNAFTQSTNTFTASISSSVGLLQTFSSSQYKADSSSFDTRITSILVGTGFTTTASFNAYTQSTNAFTASQNFINGTHATTGSNTFIGVQTISGSVLLTGLFQGSNVYVTGSITASSYSGSVAGIGNVTDYSTSVNSRTTINSQSAWGAFQTASIASASAWGSFQSASSYSASAATTYAQLGVANNFTANQTITGSAKGRVSSLTAASSTASIDCSSGNFFTFTIPSSTTTLMNPTNIQSGQTISIKMTQPATTGSVRWPSNVKYNTAGAPFTGSAVGGAVDVVTFVTFDTTTLYLAGIKNLA
jgi:hypothetical protein